MGPEKFMTKNGRNSWNIEREFVPARLPFHCWQLKNGEFRGSMHNANCQSHMRREGGLAPKEGAHGFAIPAEFDDGLGFGAPPGVNRCLPKDPHRKVSQLFALDSRIPHCRMAISVPIGRLRWQSDHDFMQRKLSVVFRQKGNEPRLPTLIQNIFAIEAQKRSVNLTVAESQKVGVDNNRVPFRVAAIRVYALRNEMAVGDLLGFLA